MDDDKKIKQPDINTDNDSSDYQKILDQAAASVKPEDIENQENPQEQTAELKEINPDIKPEEPEKLKDINAPQLEAPDDIQSIPADIPEDSSEINPPVSNQETDTSEEIAKTDVKPDNDQHELPPVYNPPKENLETQEESPKTPEEVKAQIDKILADDSNNNESSDLDSSVASKRPNGLKTIFIISLIIFFTVAALWIYFLFFYQPSTQNSSSVTPTNIPTKAVSQEVCELNGETYQVGESFSSADGCNTCSCQSVGVIACTEMACSLTPTIVATPSTKSATISPTKTTITPTKAATSSVTPSTSL